MDFFIPSRRKNSFDVSDISVEIFDESKIHVKSTFEKLTKLLGEYFCCYLDDSMVRMNPLNFEDDHRNYLALCRMFHVRPFTIALLYIKTTIFFCILLSSFTLQSDSFIKIGLFFLFSVALASYIFLVVGIHARNIRCFLPFFFVTFLFTAVGIVLFFVELLDSVNVRKAPFKNRMTLAAFHVDLLKIFVIALEFYSLIVVWRLFNYINDIITIEELRRRITHSRTDESLLPPAKNSSPPSTKIDVESSDSSSDEDETLTPMTRLERRKFRAKWLNATKNGAITKIHEVVNATT